MSAPLHAFTPYGRAGASARVRVLEWLEFTKIPAVLHTYLGASNASATLMARHPIAIGRAEHELREMSRVKPPVVLLHRECSPLTGGRLEAALLSSAMRGVYDFDDALHWDSGGNAITRPFRRKVEKAVRSIRAADEVIAGNETLGDFASAWAQHVTVIPSCVVPEHYMLKVSYELSDPPVIGWVGTPATERYLEQVGPSLLRLNAKSGARLRLMGSLGGNLGDLESIVDRVPWSEASTEKTLATWDIGIMPLGDGLYERGKCGYKLVQYAAAGLPGVASPVGVNRQMISAFAMTAAVTPDEWLSSIEELLQMSSGARMKRGAKARAVAEQAYSYASWEKVWRRVVLGE
jgi:glycosyltransferase involved in cell wall biosynthesis